MKNRLKWGVLLAATLLGLSSQAQADYIVDTGPGSDSTSAFALARAQWLAGTFSLASTQTITGIDGFMLEGNRDGQQFRITVYGDNSGNLDTGNWLYSDQTTVVDTGAAESWQGYAIPGGLVLPPGDYWAAFEVPPSFYWSVKEYAGGMREGTDAPLSGYAVGNSSGWSYSNIDFGVRIAAVPEPSALMLLLAGLGLMGAVARRRA